MITGIIYPVVMWGIAQVAFHNQANGSLVSYHGRVVGSSLLCQEFVDAKGNPLPQYFQPRPSDAILAGAKNDYGCDPLYSSASNLGPNNPVLVKLIKQRQQQIAAFDHVQDLADPAGRGDRVRLRPRPGHLPGRTPPSRWTGSRRPGTSARPRSGRWSASTPRAATLGFLGEPRVDVLKLNIALDQKYPVSSALSGQDDGGTRARTVSRTRAGRQRPVPARARARRPRVLIVEDEPALLRALRINLRARGYEVRDRGHGPRGAGRGGAAPARRGAARPRAARPRRRAR